MFWCSEKTEHEWIAARLTASGFVVKTLEAACRPSCTHTLEVAPTHCQTCVCVCVSKRHKIWSLRCFNTHAWLLSLSTCNSNRVLITLLLLCYATHKKWPEKYRLQHLGHLVSFFFFCFFFFVFNLALLKGGVHWNMCTASSSSSSLIFFSSSSLRPGCLMVLTRSAPPPQRSWLGRSLSRYSSFLCNQGIMPSVWHYQR